MATRFESDAANIAKVLVKALLNLIIKFNILEIQVVKNSEDFNVLNQSHHLLSKNDIHQLLPYIFKCQT